jgi:hypothetical protein
MLATTRAYNGFYLQIESNQLYRRIVVATVPITPLGRSVTVSQWAGNDRQFTSTPVIDWSPGVNESIEDARRFAQAIDLAAVIAADITSWLE